MRNKPKIENVTIVVRSADERTRDVCVEILKEQTGNNNIHLVNLVPFKRALEECYRIAIREKKKWLITVDADMLLLPDTVQTLISYAEEMPGNYFQLQGRIADKITGEIRKAGPRIYRVKYLDKALELSLQAQDRIRPEASVVMKMGDDGYPSRYISDITCFHDFEQYYTDLYRKSLVHAQKHPEYLISIIRRAVEFQQHDPDYSVILQAVLDGLTYGNPVSIDSKKYLKNAERTLRNLGFKEKEDNLQSNLVQDLKEQWLNNFYIVDDEKVIMDAPKPEYSLPRRFRNILRKRGFLSGFRYMTGEIFIKLGKKLKPDE